MSRIAMAPTGGFCKRRCAEGRFEATIAASMDAATAPKTTLLDDIRALAHVRRELWIVYLATLFEYIGVFSFLPTVTLWLSNDFGMSDESAGWWAATFSTLVSLFVFIVGSIADAAGIRRTLIFAFSLAAITRLGMSLSTTGTMGVTAMLLFGFAYATTSPVLQAAVHRAATKQTRSFAFSLWYVSFNIGGAIAGEVIQRCRAAFLDPATKKLATRVIDLPLIGEHTMTANGAILGVGFISAVLGVLVVMFVRKDFEAVRDPEDGPELAKVHPFVALKEVFADRAFWRFLLLLFLLSLVRMMFTHMHFTWPKYVTRVEGDDFPVGRVWGANSIMILFLAPLGTAITRGRKPFDVLLVGATISALSPFVLCFGSSLAFQWGMVIMLTIGEALWSPRLYEYTVAIAPRGRESTYVGLASVPYFLAKFLVGPTSGYLLKNFVPETGPRHPEILWAIIGVMTLMGPLGVFLLRGWLQGKDKPATEPAAA